MRPGACTASRRRPAEATAAARPPPQPGAENVSGGRGRPAWQAMIGANLLPTRGVERDVRVLGRSGRPDDDLARWLADGYGPAFRTALVLLGNRADAEEAVQDAFLRAWRFRAAVPDGEGVRPWLYRVVVNASLSKLRADGRHRRVTSLPETDGARPDWRGPTGSESGIGGGWSRGVQSWAPDPEAQAVDLERRRLVLDALAALPEHLRVVVVLRYYGQLSEREIADVIGRRPGTVKSRLHEARTRLGNDRRLELLATDALLPGVTSR